MHVRKSRLDNFTVFICVLFDDLMGLMLMHVSTGVIGRARSEYSTLAGSRQEPFLELHRGLRRQTKASK